MSESVYILPCPCGEEVRSPVPVVNCPKCGRTLEVQNWGKPPTDADNRAAIAFFESERKNGKAKGAA